MADQKHLETALVLSAGAPTAPLIAGVLHAFYEQGVRFPLIYASGASALVALVLVAPRVPNRADITSGSRAGLDARLAALANIPRVLGVADDIYRYIPLGYKTFFKPGPYTAPFRAWSQNFKLSEEPRKGNRALDALAHRLGRWLDAEVLKPTAAPAWKRLYNDWVDLATSVMTPPLFTFGSRGLCAPFPLVEDLVDFDLLRDWTGKLHIPAYDLSAKPGDRLVQFTNTVKKGDERMLAGPEEVRACLAGAFIYPPVEIEGHLYTEGAFHDPQNVQGWIDEFEETREQRGIDNVLILDTLGTSEMEEILLRPPRGLRDAYGLSIMTAAVAAARAQTKIFTARLEALHQERQARRAPDEYPPLFSPFEWRIPQALRATLTEWNYGNLSALFEHGRYLGGEYLKAPSKRFAPRGVSPKGAPTHLELLSHASFRGRRSEYHGRVN